MDLVTGDGLALPNTCTPDFPHGVPSVAPPGPQFAANLGTTTSPDGLTTITAPPGTPGNVLVTGDQLQKLNGDGDKTRCVTCANGTKKVPTGASVLTVATVGPVSAFMEQDVAADGSLSASYAGVLVHPSPDGWLRANLEGGVCENVGTQVGPALIGYVGTDIPVAPGVAAIGGVDLHGNLSGALCTTTTLGASVSPIDYGVGVSVPLR